MRVSFRTRLLVVSGLMVGAVLSAVLWLGWSRVLAFEVERLELRLCMEARRLATRPFQGEELTRLEADMVNKLHLSSPEQLTMRFESGVNGSHFQSRNWTAALALSGSQWQDVKSSNAVQEANVRPDGPPPRPGEVMGQPMGGPPPEAGTCALASFSTNDLSGRQWRAARFTVSTGLAVVAADLAATVSELQGAFAQALKLVIPLALILTVLGAWLLSAFTMRPVNRLRDAMKNVTPKALDQRLSSAGEDREFKVLIDAYNTMLARLESSFQQASRFSADAAHELKTPLTILQGRLEQALRQSVQPQVQAELTDLLDEVARLSMITRKLLLLSQADAGRLALHVVPVDMSAMLDELATDAQMLLTGQTLSCAIEPHLLVQGDAVLLRQLFNNLVSNAVRYCLPGAWIKIRAQALATGIEIVFSNAAHPTALVERGRFFDRFYRGDVAHNRHIDGSGLGLSLAREIAHAHGGELVLAATALDVVALRLTLPRRRSAVVDPAD